MNYFGYDMINCKCIMLNIICVLKLEFVDCFDNLMYVFT